ncbi:YceI family protein [Flavobacteriaceae bacterium AU392]|nr:YceI family protein [Flavobacteriaceae bacterium]RKM83603.1 YceI family protein [Flavobacteriaceae bacterium AU392]
MKKISFLILLSIITFSCKKNAKETKNDETTNTEIEQFVVKPEATSVTWTAYKTTAKVGVGGEFNTLNFDNKAGASPEEALNNLSFSIPVSSLFTKDVGRDSKIKSFFFGAMLNTSLLKGSIKVNNGKYIASITMNGVTGDLPLEVSITEGRRVKLTGIMNLEEWDALEALETLNKACFDLHKGEDGVSKTWEEVAIEVSTYLRKN